MSKPTKKIDGAKVLEWAWSGDKPFGELRYESGEIASNIFGLAVCQYDGSDIIYRLSCDSNWETEQDSDYQSVADAKENLPMQYRNIEAYWQTYE